MRAGSTSVPGRACWKTWADTGPSGAFGVWSALTVRTTPVPKTGAAETEPMKTGALPRSGPMIGGARGRSHPGNRRRRRAPVVGAGGRRRSWAPGRRDRILRLSQVLRPGRLRVDRERHPPVPGADPGGELAPVRGPGAHRGAGCVSGRGPDEPPVPVQGRHLHGVPRGRRAVW